MDNNQIPDWHHLPENKFNPHAWVVGKPKIGKDTWIGAFTVIDGSGGLSIGDNCDISAGAQIYTHSTVKRCLNKNLSDAEHEIDKSPVTIGSNVHIGAGAIILKGCTIGDQCIIAAGAVLKEHTIVKSKSVVVGVPGRVIKGMAPANLL